MLTWGSYWLIQLPHTDKCHHESSAFLFLLIERGLVVALVFAALSLYLSLMWLYLDRQPTVI
jgi:hypothetical protein